MIVYAARYGTGRDYFVVIYTTEADATGCPHDWDHDYAPAKWRKLGCRVPKKDEVMRVELSACEVTK